MYENHFNFTIIDNQFNAYTWVFMNCFNVYLKNVAVKIQLSFKCGGWTITMRVLDQEPWGLNGAVS